jgi:hypothetical protein
MHDQQLGHCVWPIWFMHSRPAMLLRPRLGHLLNNHECGLTPLIQALLKVIPLLPSGW